MYIGILATSYKERPNAHPAYGHATAILHMVVQTHGSQPLSYSLTHTPDY